MTRGPEQFGASDAQCPWVALIADAIRAAFFRYQTTGEPIPFLYNFVDYLELGASLEPSSHVRICLAEDTIAGLRVHPDGADRLATEVLAHLGVLDKQLPSAMQAAIRAVLQQPIHIPQTRAKAASLGTAVGAAGDLAAVQDILQNTANNLSEAIRLIDSACQVIIRYWAADQWKYSQLHAATGTSTPSQAATSAAELDQGMLDAFHSGFARRVPTNDGNYLICTPCHFGGVPWLVICRRCPATGEGRWQAYMSYRDVATRFNDMLRMLAQYSYASEMRRLFVHHVVGNRLDARKLQRDVSHAWSVLSCVYPVRRPRFLNPDELSRPETVVLPFGDQEWRVEFSADPSPFLNSQQVLESRRGEQWGTIDARVLQTGFRDPVLAELRKEDLRRANDLATGAYKIGHPLKDRVGPLRRALATIETELKAHKEPSQVLQLVGVAQQRAQRIESLGHLLDVISRAISSRRGAATFRAKAEWHRDSEYSLADALRGIVQTVNESERYTLSIPEPGWQSLAGSLIDCWITEDGPPIRPADLFYREVLTEILTNAARRGQHEEDRVALNLSRELLPDEGEGQKSVPCVVFSNRAFEAVDTGALGLERVGHWDPWNLSETGAVGGLFFIANCLEQTASGRLFVRVDRDSLGDTFRVGLWLCGVRFSIAGKEGLP